MTTLSMDRLTFDAEILHCYPGKRHADRREVEFLTTKHERPFKMDGYFWLGNEYDHRMRLVASYLEAAQHTQERVRVFGVETTWGFRITWAEPVEKSA